MYRCVASRRSHKRRKRRGVCPKRVPWLALEADPKDWSSSLVVILMTYGQAGTNDTSQGRRSGGSPRGPTILRTSLDRETGWTDSKHRCVTRWSRVSSRDRTRLRDRPGQGLRLPLGSPRVLINCWQLAKLSFSSALFKGLHAGTRGRVNQPVWDLFFHIRPRHLYTYANFQLRHGHLVKAGTNRSMNRYLAAFQRTDR